MPSRRVYMGRNERTLIAMSHGSVVPIAERLPDAWLAAADYLGLVPQTIPEPTTSAAPRRSTNLSASVAVAMSRGGGR